MKKLALVPLALMALPSLAAAHSRLVAQDEAGGDATAEVALVEETVHVTIDEQYAQARLRQVFHNRSDRRLEGRYSLVLGDGIRVDGFAYWTGGQKIVGEVFEKETAARVYEEVTGLGRDPGLLEQVGEGAFSFRLFPIEPDERKPVEVYWGGWLRRSGNVVEYRLPLGHAHSSVELHLRDARGIREVSSATHAIELQNDSATHVVVRARGPGKGSGSAGTADQATNSDSGAELVLRYVVGGADWQVSAFVHRDEGQDGYLVTSLAAPALVGEAEVAAKDITLVLDHSGSMSGEPLEQAKAAAKAVVARLRDDDRVNVIAFDDNVDTLYAVPRAMSETTRKEALAYIDRLHDAGGTNLALALERALAAQEANGRPHVILFLTDGQSDAQATIKAARADTGDARVFTIGVGSGVEKPLLSRLAGEKRGRFTYIASIPAIEHKVAELYTQIDAPVLVGVSIEAKGAQLAGTYPRTTPDLFRHDELVLSSRIRGDGPVTLTIRGQLQGKAVAFTKVVQVPRTATRPWVGRMWAAARVDDLLEEIALYGETDELKTEAINLAVAYNLASPYTSFLAIPESELTDGARELLATARERKQRILAAHKDAVALSRSSMPPGDPILSVRAPQDARQVTAYFPFGLVKDLGYDADTEKWQVRFLVPKDVVDGDYMVKIVIVHADGTVEVAEIPYTIDSGAPDFEVTVEETAAGALIKVATAEESRLVTVVSTTDLSMRVELSRRADGLYFEGTLPLSAGTHELRVVVADAARNEADSLINVVIEPELEPEIKPGIED